MIHISNLFFVLVYNALLLLGAYYLVFIKHCSGWWFVLALILMASLTNDKEED
jgi:hypothetical protein